MDENHLAHMVAAAIFFLLQSNYFINIKQTEEQNVVLLTVLRDLCQHYQNSDGTGNNTSSRRMEKESRTALGKVTINWFSNCCHGITHAHKYAHTFKRTWNCTLLYFVWMSSHLVTHSFTTDTHFQLKHYYTSFSPTTLLVRYFYLISLLRLSRCVHNFSNKFLDKFCCIALHTCGKSTEFILT